MHLRGDTAKYHSFRIRLFERIGFKEKKGFSAGLLVLFNVPPAAVSSVETFFLFISQRENVPHAPDLHGLLATPGSAALIGVRTSCFLLVSCYCSDATWTETTRRLCLMQTLRPDGRDLTSG